MPGVPKRHGEDRELSVGAKLGRDPERAQRPSAETLAIAELVRTRNALPRRRLTKLGASSLRDIVGSRLTGLALIWIKPRGYVRFGSLADIGPIKRDVRFTPESGHRLGNIGWPTMDERQRYIDWSRAAFHSLILPEMAVIAVI